MPQPTHCGCGRLSATWPGSRTGRRTPAPLREGRPARPARRPAPVRARGRAGHGEGAPRSVGRYRAPTTQTRAAQRRDQRVAPSAERAIRQHPASRHRCCAGPASGSSTLPSSWPVAGSSPPTLPYASPVSPRASSTAIRRSTTSWSPSSLSSCRDSVSLPDRSSPRLRADARRASRLAHGRRRTTARRERNRLREAGGNAALPTSRSLACVSEGVPVRTPPAGCARQPASPRRSPRGCRSERATAGQRSAWPGRIEQSQAAARVGEPAEGSRGYWGGQPVAVRPLGGIRRLAQAGTAGARRRPPSSGAKGERSCSRWIGAAGPVQRNLPLRYARRERHRPATARSVPAHGREGAAAWSCERSPCTWLQSSVRTS